MSTYKIEDKELASVTTIISDCTDKSSALCPWAASQTVEWIKGHADSYLDLWWKVTPEDLDNARIHFREVSQEALDVGSAVHDAIRYYLNTGKEPEWLK